MYKSFLIFIALFLIACSPAMATIAVDGTPQSGTVTSTNTTSSVATTSAQSWTQGDVVFACVRNADLDSNGEAHVSSISSGAGTGLTWALASSPSSTNAKVQIKDSSPTFPYQNTVELWYAVATATSSGIITATLSRSDAAVAGIVTVALQGANNQIPIDAVGTAATAGTVSAFPTVTPLVGNTLAFACFHGNRYASVPIATTGYTTQGSSNNAKAWMITTLENTANSTLSAVSPGTISSPALSPDTVFSETLTVLVRPINNCSVVMY